MLLELSHFFSPLYSPQPCTSLPPASPDLSSCPWVIHISSLAFPFPLLFLTSPVYSVPNYAFYSLYLFPDSLPSSSPLITLHMISLSVILFLF